jgi:hypothetical protein
MKKFGLFCLLAGVSLTQGFDYMIDVGESSLGLFLIDIESGIDSLQSLHTGDTIAVEVSGIAWIARETPTDTSNLTYSTFLDGDLVATGTVDLSADGKTLPGSVAAGEITVTSAGRRTITVELVLDGVKNVAESEYECFGAGVAMFPLLVILILAATTQMVELSLFSGIFVGACIVGGSMKEGFFRTLDNYILNALASVDHGYVYLFTFFLSGLVGMMEKSGGFGGFTKTMSKYATTARAGQMTTFVSGCLIFFVSIALNIGCSLIRCHTRLLTHMSPSTFSRMITPTRKSSVATCYLPLLADMSIFSLSSS